MLTFKQAIDFLEKGIRPCTDDYINNQVLDEIEYYLSKHDVHPAVFIGYSRKAFFANLSPASTINCPSDKVPLTL